MIGLRQSIGSIVKIVGSIEILGWLKYSTKMPTAFAESVGSSLDSSSAWQLFSLGIWTIRALLKYTQICFTSSWYFFKDESQTSYSPDICQVTSCESAYIAMCSALTRFASLRPANKASYSAGLFVIGNINLKEY